MKKMNFRLAFGLTTLLLLAIAVFIGSILGDLRGARIDLTEDKQFTLSESAQTILEKLKVPVQVKYYVTRSDKMPTELKNLERDVTDKLLDFASASGGFLEFSIHDPSDDEELKQLLQTKGVRPFQVQSVEKDEIGLKLIYSAVSIAYKDKSEEILPQVLPQSLASLEYEIVSRVFRLTQDKDPVVALYAPKPQHDPQMLQMYMQMGMQPPELPDTWQPVVELLQSEHYDVRRIDLTRESPIPSDADALLVLGPLNTNPRQAWEIGRAVSRGVNTLIAVQNLEYAYNPAPRGGFQITAKQRFSGLEGLLQNYGMAVRGDQLFDAEHEVISIPRQQNIGGMRFQTSEPVRAPMQIAVRGEQMNREVSITNRIDQVFYLWGTDIAMDPTRMIGLNLGSRVLFTASDQAWRKPFSADPLTQEDIDKRNKLFEEALPLAALFDGQFPDFGEEAPPDWPGAAPDTLGAEPPEELAFAGAPSPAQLLLIGCGKVFEQPFIQGGQNALLLLNSVDALALGGDLIGIRSKLITARALKPVEAGQKVMYRLFVVILVPLLITIYGIARLLMRRKESADYIETVSLGSR